MLGLKLKEINRKLKSIIGTEKTVPLSKRGKDIKYNFKNSLNILEIIWGSDKITLSIKQIHNILNEFFVTDDKWYPLGSSMTDPMENGLGKFIDDNFNSLTPRHASVIAAVLVNENILTNKGAKPIELKKCHK